MPTDFHCRRRRALLAGIALLGCGVLNRNAGAQSGEAPMERVQGVGGIFFRAQDPAMLAQWYEDNLGVTKVPETYDKQAWRSEAGTTVFAPFPADTDYFGDSKQQWMLNFRVKNLDAMVTQLRARGIAVEIDPKEYPNGRFARLKDPEGNPIELWQPGGKARD